MPHAGNLPCPDPSSVASAGSLPPSLPHVPTCAPPQDAPPLPGTRLEDEPTSKLGAPFVQACCTRPVHPEVVHVRKTQRHSSAPSLRTCTSARTGARGWSKRTPKPASVRLFLSECQRPGLRAFELDTGELGNKWKELDDDEKNVSLYFFIRLSNINVCYLCSSRSLSR